MICKWKDECPIGKLCTRAKIDMEDGKEYKYEIIGKHKNHISCDGFTWG